MTVIALLALLLGSPQGSVPDVQSVRGVVRDQTGALKAGIQIPDFSRRGFDDRANRDGTFTFSSLDDYALGHPLSFTMQQGDRRLADALRGTDPHQGRQEDVDRAGC
jgi:hypothetical protein